MRMQGMVMNSASTAVPLEIDTGDVVGFKL